MKENTITKEANVVMLATKGHAPFGVNSQNNIYYIFNTVVFGEGQHLYFTTDEEIKKREWMYYNVGGSKGIRISIDNTNNPMYKKIIATTNPELWRAYGQVPNVPIDRSNGIPKIPITFIEAYVREQGNIDKVLLKYELSEPIGSFTNHNEPYTPSEEILKLRPDGSVIIHPIKKKMYTRDEVIDACYKFKYFNDDIRQNSRTISSSEWFNTNYPQ